MAAIRVRLIGISLGSLAAALLLAGVTAAQAPGGKSDLLEETRKRTEIEAQKIVSEVRDALLAAQKQTAADSVKSLETLKSVLAGREDDKILRAARRESLKHMLQDRIRVTETAANSKDADVDERAERLAQAADRRAEEKRRAAAADKLSEELRSIAK